MSRLVRSLLIAGLCVPPALLGSGASHAQGTVTINVFAGSIFAPSKVTTVDAQHPFLRKALILLTQRFEAQNPDIKVNLVPVEDVPSEQANQGFAPWLAARNAAGTVPEVEADTVNGAAAQDNGWCTDLTQYFHQPNPYIPGNKQWIDIFYPHIQTSMTYAGGKNWYLPLNTNFPGVTVELAVNKDALMKAGLSVPTTWTQELAAGQKLQAMGLGGISPWPSEAKEGNIWPIYFQLGQAFFQSVIPTIDTNHNGDLDVTEASNAVISGKVSVKTPQLRALWEEEYKLARLWTPGWASTDLDLLWRQGKLGVQYQGNWQIRNLMSDPTLAFTRVAAPAPVITHADDPLASNPIGLTKANGKVDPNSIILDPLQGTTHLCIMKSSTTAHHNFAAALKYVQFLGTPTNLAFLVNEYGDGIPPVPNVALNPIWQQFTHYSFPTYKYTISGWQVVFPNTPATDQEGRRSFVSWVTGQISESTFFSQLEKELIESAKAMLK